MKAVNYVKESYKELIEAGYPKPTLILETSKNNFQVHYRITNANYSETLELSQYFNQEYGDPKKKTLDTSLRLPTFTNHKYTQHREIVEVVQAEGGSYDLDEIRAVKEKIQGTQEM